MPEPEKQGLSFEEKAEQVSQKFDAAGKKMQSIGCALTLLITLPVIGTLVGGVVGGIIGGAIGLLLFVGMFVGGKKQ